MDTKKKLLVVDDDSINTRILHKILDSQYTIYDAENGEIALDILAKKKDELSAILLDLKMPVMDGFEVLKRIRQDSVMSQIPVIVTTGNDDSETENLALSLGANDFIGKPYNAQVAKHRVNNVLAESKLLAIEKENALAKEFEKMRYYAEHDALTGLYNRTALETRMNSLFTSNKNTDGYFIMIDIDNFKTINDVFGHDKGDKVLNDIGNILNGYFGKKDIVTRLGGDEFAVFVLQKASVREIDKKVSILCKKLQLQFGGIDIT